ncbi:NAD-dependent epimerase/dehydratase family protein [Candidatus Peregrinibacteria bacterium]|jgi:UDP-glucose 4-epimerase|nr:NAD-dependent epimerase/dehydratase family protein [Candidatus Peregrinibacteria bacterium]MBT4056157.1 NAD-dependent epimerase/dehydratase family protein [Candidatus Peregrinibacteria bacterium]
MRCLVLGADGFLGSHLVDGLLSKGFEVRAFARFSEGKSKNLEHLRDKIEFVAGDFLNQDDIDKATKDIDIVFHFVSFTTPASSINDPLIDIDTNIRGTVQLLEKCAKNGVKQLVFPSSGGTVYGNISKDMFSEDDLTMPVSPYGISKLTIERYLEYFKINFGLNYLALRYSNPYGTRQNLAGGQGIIPIFLNRIKTGEPITIFGDGENVRDYIYVGDCVDLTMQILSKEDRAFNLYNVGSGVPISINDLVRVIQKVTGKEFSIERLPDRSCYLKKVVLDNTRLLQEVGSRGLVGLEEGIELMWKSI